MYAGGREVLDAPGVVLLATPHDPVGGIALQMENQRWLVTAVGFGERRPPRDADGFSAFLRALPDPALADLVARCTPIGDVVIYRQTANRRHRYERMAAWPDGLLTIGDALCTFDPIYGQGITVAALEAVVLRDALDRAASGGGVAAGYSVALLRRFASVVDLPWGVATGEDLRFMSDGSRQGLAQRILGAWARRLNRMAVHGNDRARFQLAKTYHLMGSPLGLFHPALVAGALRPAVIGEGPAAPRPDSLEALRAATLPG
jgi:2-polyprenyl-6-methoxyphenol hydroxylase-like FAD-dependent oxidoreductase